MIYQPSEHPVVPLQADLASVIKERYRWGIFDLAIKAGLKTPRLVRAS